MTDNIMGGMAVNPITGRPYEKGPTAKQLDDEKKLESEIAAALEAERKLKTKSGKEFVALIEKELEERIEELVKQDPEALTLLGLLSKFGRDIKVGEAAAQRLTRMRLGRQAREIPQL